MNDVPLDLCIAGYSDPTAAKLDFDALKKAQREGIVMIDSAILVARDADGAVHVKETATTTSTRALRSASPAA